MATIISDLPALTPAPGTVVYAENSSQSGKIDVNTVSNYAVTEYNGATLAGSAQTPKAAIDGLNDKIGDTAMGTTATTVTGAIAEHESDFGTLGSNLDAIGEQLNGMRVIKTSVSNNSSLTITCASVTRGLISCYSYYAAGRALYMLTSSTATAYCTDVMSASGIAVATDGMDVTFTNTSGGNVYVIIQVYSGTVTLPS